MGFGRSDAVIVFDFIAQLHRAAPGFFERLRHRDGGGVVRNDVEGPSRELLLAGFQAGAGNSWVEFGADLDD